MRKVQRKHRRLNGEDEGNHLPQFIPGFFVTRLMHGSPCPSHLGGILFPSNFDQDSLVSKGSMNLSLAGSSSRRDGPVSSSSPSASFTPGRAFSFSFLSDVERSAFGMRGVRPFETGQHPHLMLDSLHWDSNSHVCLVLASWV